ncbi:MAG TPA: hypothetical protein VMT19_09600 [Thermoanaerobaculaceae bacterium]|nr:hypothetical protein [Thermoanaerobaculaceae bacterium]
MFEPLGKSESERSGSSRKRMTIVWSVVGVLVIVLVVIAFA